MASKISFNQKLLPLVFIIVAVMALAFHKYNSHNSEGQSGKILSISERNAEFKKVINYYKKQSDSRKLKAAIFLINNIEFQYHYSGNGVITYRKSFDLMDSIFKSNHGIFNSSWDSIQKLRGTPSLADVAVKKDLNTIKADLLIRHINAAFRAWNFPWATTLNFEEFCNYILPYKLVNEEPEVWMEKIQKDYSWLIDSMGTSKDLRKACILINRSLRHKYNLNGRFKCYWDVNYSDLSKLRQGPCNHLTQLTTYVMRAMGIPVTMDFTPHWGNKNGGHGWNGLLYKGKVIIFMGCESDPGKTKLEFTRSELMIRKIAKIYRKMYDNQEQDFSRTSKTVTEVDGFFKNQRNLDVTEDFLPVGNVSITIDNPKSFTLIYLCVFNGGRWQSVAVTQIGLFSKAVFKNVGKGIVYMPMFLNDGDLEPAGPPFLFTYNYTLRYFTINKKQLINCTLERKYPEDKSNLIEVGLTYELLYWDNKWVGINKHIATEHVVRFDHVPDNTLLLLKCLSKGKQERIFSYDKGKQVWW